MLSLGPLLSDLSASPGPSVAGRFWPFALGAFLILTAVVLFFALGGSEGRKRDAGDEEERDDG